MKKHLNVVIGNDQVAYTATTDEGCQDRGANVQMQCDRINRAYDAIWPHQIR